MSCFPAVVLSQHQLFPTHFLILWLTIWDKCINNIRLSLFANEWSFSSILTNWRLAMALPIAATPVLKGREASDFLRQIEKDLQKPLTYTPTPKLGQAKKLIKKYAAKRTK
ncbi:MAG: hypothetical protein GXP59_06220 [Deltaproteobacteria bacterium]|nr:hypothetical protein [Deltaproteobacteria bacterium]